MIDNFTVNYGWEGVPQVNEIASIYPNPATTALNITAKEKITSIAISNVVGQQVFTQNFNTQNAHIDIADLPKGVYIIKVNDVSVKKFVKN